MISRAVVVVAVVLVAAPVLPAQSRKEPKRVGLDEIASLTRIVEDAIGQKAAGGHAWLTWTPHFLRGPDGKTYVPFTLTIDEAPGLFKAAAMYIRVAPRGDEGRQSRDAKAQDLISVPADQMPIGLPERGQRAGVSTPGQSFARLRGLTSRARTAYPYEAAYGIEPGFDASGRTASVRRALAVPPGEYDIYVSMLERDQKGEKKWAVLKQPLTVPDLSAGDLRLSSVILADRVEQLAKAPAPAEQPLYPYALGTAEIVPALDAELRQDETLQVAFVIYNASADAAGKPDVRIDYRLFLQNFAAERSLGATEPQALDASTLPRTFDLRKGEQLAAMQTLPLATYKPGSYRLAIRVTDNRNGGTAGENVRFTLLP